MRALARNAYPFAVASAVFILAVGLPSSDSDTYWQLAAGRWMLEHRQLLREDIFSSTVNGTHLAIGEWLGQIAFGAAYDVLGWAGVVIVRAVCVGIAAFFTVRLARANGAPVAVSLVLATAALAVSKITWTDRPLIFTLALFPLLLDVLFSLRPGRSRRLLVLPPLFLLWASLHGGYLLGLVVVAIFAVHALLTTGRAGVPLLLTTMACAAFTFVNPAPLEVAGAAVGVAPPRSIAEYAPTDVLTPAGAVFAAFVLATVATALLRGGTLLEALLLPPLLYLSLSAQRHMFFFPIATLPFLAHRVGSLLPASLRVERLRRPIGVPIAIALGLAAVAAAATAPTAPDDTAYPTEAVASLRDHRGVLFNEYDWGGYLIFALPERPVFIDGRYIPYVGRVFADYRTLVGVAPGWREVLERYRVAEALLEPSRPLAGALREDGWRVRAEDRAGHWVLLARP
jgi:hypothetical protein